MNQVIKILKDMLARKGFYKLTITVQMGKVVHIDKAESIKPEGKTHG